ncbi:hypothetical protein K402DRAFT_44968 [Aulographum hederae CBS 113979]|uniref:Uncharacterized protein n=1 Tax=Aulographum hederae CBS 113979 TaxID=1176131 RepID=A0A6G1H412_9PEZI|nr:hypothetical protein K402DRAFT_44968 [Aulographum hederae CBS 113979]
MALPEEDMTTALEWAPAGLLNPRPSRIHHETNQLGVSKSEATRRPHDTGRDFRPAASSTKSPYKLNVARLVRICTPRSIDRDALCKSAKANVGVERHSLEGNPSSACQFMARRINGGSSSAVILRIARMVIFLPILPVGLSVFDSFLLRFEPQIREDTLRRGSSMSSARLGTYMYIPPT